MAGAPSILDQIYYCNTGKGLKLGDGVTPVADLPIIGGGNSVPGPPGQDGAPGIDGQDGQDGQDGKDGLPGPVGIVLDPDDPRAIQHNQQVGEIVAFYGDYAPVGTLLCDGSMLEIADYPKLGEFLIAQNQELDSGDGEHFLLPDLRDMFLRGQGVDRSLGSLQEDAIRNISGIVAIGFFNKSMASIPTNPVYGQMGIDNRGPSMYNQPAEAFYHIYLDVSRQVPTADENRPKNIAVSFAIRYETSVLCAVPLEHEGGGIPQTPNDNIIYGIRNNQLVPILAVP